MPVKMFQRGQKGTTQAQLHGLAAPHLPGYQRHFSEQLKAQHRS